VGSPIRLEYTVIGSTVNVGARLADTAAPGQILTTRQTLERVRHLVDWRMLGEQQFQGVPYPVQVIEVRGLRLSVFYAGEEDDRPLDNVLLQVADDPTYRTLLLTHPDEVLGSASLPADQRELTVGVARLLGYPLFRGMSGLGLQRFVHRARPERFAEGTMIVRQGDVSERCYVLTKGTVAVLKSDADGHEHHLATLGPGAHFGEIGMLRGTPRTASVLAVTDVECFSLDREDFQHIQAAASSFGENMRVEVARREAAADAWL
jgi:hypothetical protein